VRTPEYSSRYYHPRNRLAHYNGRGLGANACFLWSFWYYLPVMTHSSVLTGVNGGLKPPVGALPSRRVGTLFTLGRRFFQEMAEVAVISGEIAVVHGVASETMVSDIDVIANSPTNTSGFSTYMGQVSVISTDF
jgi:hypothetical protein